MPVPQMARYLATAGLQRDEAEALVANVKSSHKDQMRASLENKFYSSFILCAAGVGFVFVPFPFNGVIAACLVVAGIGMALHYRGRMNALE